MADGSKHLDSTLGPSSSESLWAEHGLTGLVLFALFGVILLFIRVNTKKDTSTQAFIKKILDDERSERESERRERTETRKENSENSTRLSKAIDSLAAEMRRNNK